MDEHHDKDNDATRSSEQRAESVAETQNPSGADQRRRRFLQGAAATSAVYTLGTRPVLANDVCTSSVLMSGNVSLHDEQTSCRLGCSPWDWKKKDARWEGIEYAGRVIGPDTPFADIFLSGFIGLGVLSGQSAQSEPYVQSRGGSGHGASNGVDPELLAGLADILEQGDGRTMATSSRGANGLGGNANSNAFGGNENKGGDFQSNSIWQPKVQLLQAASYAVAALLNAAHPEVNGSLYPNNNGYPHSADKIVGDFKTAYWNYLFGNDSDYGLSDFVTDYNDYQDRYCPLPDFYS